MAKITEKLPENRERLTEKLPEKPNRLTENKERLIEKLIEKVSINGDKLTENKIAILTIMIEDPYIYKSDLSKFVGISKLLLVITLKQCVVNASVG